MVNIFVVSNNPKQLYAPFKGSGVMPDTHDPGKNAIGYAAHEGNLEKYDLAFLDLDIPDWQQHLQELRQQMPVIAFSEPDIKKAVESMKLGASDYVEKPLSSEVLNEIIKGYGKKILNHMCGFDEITGVSSAMQEVFGLLKKAAMSESNVLITGESGTGKELIARAIHRWSPRCEKSFMTINCSAIPDTLLESELFGFEKGSFTGANYTRKGLFESADGGTVFFDEVGDVSALFQTKILRVLQEGEIMRIGGNRQMKVDVRIITATNKDLRTACARGLFREDLFYRLNVINIQLPPLRERTEDIPLLAKHFIEKHGGKRKDLFIKGLTDDALGILKGHSYPGNVRELENIIEHAISFANASEIFPADLPSGMAQQPMNGRATATRLREALLLCEKEVIMSALNESGGNISRAAASLGIYRQQLQRKLKSLHIAT
jgi:DNA-binding NtrC family response regulator